jgi:hypothetical protein
MIALDEKGTEALGCRTLPARPGAAEVAVTVVDDWHGSGLGTLLLAAISARAREAGIRTFTAWMLACNQEMMDLFQHLGPVQILDRSRHRRDRGRDPHRRSRPRAQGAAWPRGQARCRGACHASRRPSDDPLKEPACRTPDRRAHAQRLVSRAIGSDAPSKLPSRAGDPRFATRAATLVPLSEKRMPTAGRSAPLRLQAATTVTVPSRSKRSRRSMSRRICSPTSRPTVSKTSAGATARVTGDATQRRPLGLAVLAIRDVAGQRAHQPLLDVALSGCP